MRILIRSRSRCAPILGLAAAVTMSVGFAIAAATADDEAGLKPGEDVAPRLPAAVLAAIEESRFDVAIAALDGLIREEKRSPDDRAFLVWIKGVALRKAGRADEAASLLRTAMADAPGSIWTSKLRGTLADVELSRKRPDEAERLSRAGVEALLAPTRKDRLAGIVEMMAVRLMAPGDPLVHSDPGGAYPLLELAHALARGDEARARIRFRMAAASQTAGKLDRAADDLRAYLREHPHGADRDRAQFQLGDVLFQGEGQDDAARAQWSELARRLEGPARTDARARDFRGRCLYQIGRSYLTQLDRDDAAARNRAGLGIAKLRRFLQTDPAHRMAVDAAYEIAEALAKVARSDEALAAFRDVIEGRIYFAETPEGRRRKAELSAGSAYQVGVILRRQGRLAEAADAFERCIEQYPSGPQLAEAQRAILDVRLALADEDDRRGRFAEARAIREAFVTRNPLDLRTPAALFRNGRSLMAEGQVDRAIAAWEDLIARFPVDVASGHAQWEIARLFEEKRGDPAHAIERLRKIILEPWKSKARERIAVLEAKSLVVVTPRSYRSGKVAALKVTTRNIPALTVSVYRLDAEEYFRKRHAMTGVDALDIDLVKPEHTWSEPVPGYAQYVPVEQMLSLKPLDSPGAWVVKVGDDAALHAVTLVLVSDVDALIKASRDQVLVFAQDQKTGRGRAGAVVLAADDSGIVLTGKTGADGVLLANWPRPREPGHRLDYLVLDGPHVASTGFDTSNTVAQGLTPRALIYTERPAYRPGHRVEVRGIVREVTDGHYDANPGAPYRLEVIDSRGRRIVGRAVKLSAFGTFHEEVLLDSSAPVGTYRIRVHRPGGSEFSGSFEVQAYGLSKANLTITVEPPVVFRGESISGGVAARYPDETPMADRPIEVKLPDGRTLRGRTGPDGRFSFILPTEGFTEAQTLRIVARLAEEDVEAEAVAAVAVRGFTINAETSRSVYLSGEPFSLRAVTRDSSGKPIGQALSVSVIKHVAEASRIEEDDVLVSSQASTIRMSEREIVKVSLQTAADSGEGSVTIKIEDDDGGPYVLRLSGKDRFGNPVIAERTIMISGSRDVKLRLLSDDLRFKVGEPAKINLHNRRGAGTALVAWEADRILKYRLVPIKVGDNPIAWDIEGNEFPNVTLTASRMSEAALDESRLDLTIDRDLRVSLAPSHPVVKPGEPVEVEITTRDQLGRPVAAELSLAMVDRALLARFGESLPPIREVFYSQSRIGAFTTRSTNAFRYEPAAMSTHAEPTTPTRPKPTEMRPRPRKPALPEDERSRAVLRILDLTINLQFPAETPLEDVVKYIRQATETEGHPGLQIYVDPIGLQEAERSMLSTVLIDLQDVPLRTGLKLMLAQLGLAYKVEDGILMIISEDQYWSEQAENQGAPPGMAGMGGMMAGMGGMGGGAGFGAGGRGAVPVNPSRGTQQEEAKSAPAKPTARKDEATDKKEEKKPAPKPREVFVETAYWNPSVITDANGHARVTFRAPSALAEYRLAALGATGAETMVGQATAGLSVRQAFSVELKAPAVLTEGDQPRLPVRLQHPGIKGRARVSLTVAADGRNEVFPKVVELSESGVTELLLDAFRVPGVDRIRLMASATSGAGDDRINDEVAVDVPVRAWGLPVFATTSGRSSVDTTVFVALPTGRRYENPEMRIALTPRADRMLVELALKDPGTGLDRRPELGCMPVGTTIEHADDLLGEAAALTALRRSPDVDSDADARLSSRIADGVTRLVTTQNPDGSWSWIPDDRKPEPAGDLSPTARAVRALTAAEPLGLGPDPSVLDRATRYLEQSLARLDAGRSDTRAAVLHALALRNRARFESVNALLRERQVLSDRSLALLALTLAKMDHADLADEVLGLLAGRARAEASGPGSPLRRYWSDGAASTGRDAAVETTATAALAFARIHPGSPEAVSARDWLLAHRIGVGWLPAEAGGLVLQALAEAPADGGGDDHYRLVVNVNDAEALRTEVRGDAAGREIVVPRAALKAGAENRVSFDIEGRGRFGYAVTLSGITREFEVERVPGAPAPLATIRRRVYLAVPPELDSRPLDTGFDTVINAQPFANVATEVKRGGRIRVEIEAERNPTPGREDLDEPIVLHEHLPAGTSLVPGSVVGDASHVDFSDGLLTFFFSAGSARPSVSYEMRGDVPGRYRVLPASVRAADDPARLDIGKESGLAVLAPGDAITDVYRPSPDELYDRGKRHFEAGRLDAAASPLEALFNGFTLRDDVLKDTARMLLFVDLSRHDDRRIVRDYEIVREKSPDLFLAFETLMQIGGAYAGIGEDERAYLGWTAMAEASHREDARVGEVLRQRGRGGESVALLLRLWRETPGGATVDADLLRLAQRLADGRSGTDSSRAERLRQSSRLIETFLAAVPGNPMADEAGLALVADAYELGEYARMVEDAGRFARVHPESKLRDRFRYAEALGAFYLGQFDRAIGEARQIADVQAPPRADTPREVPPSIQALALLGRIHEARLEPAEALSYYRRVGGRIRDATEAVTALTSRSLRVPEITAIRPPSDQDQPAPLPLAVSSRNLSELDVRVYPVDPMRLFPGRDDLGAIASVELAGIRPVHRAKEVVGNGRVEAVEETHRVNLPIEREGAFLVMLRGEDRFASGLVLVSPIELTVSPLADEGRIRIAVRDARTGRGVSGARVKVVGSPGGAVQLGETDLRGVFVADATEGRLTVIARSGTSRYAIYRSPPEARRVRRRASVPVETESASDLDLRALGRRGPERPERSMQERGPTGIGGFGGMMGGGFR